MKTDSKIAIGISSVLIGIGIFLFLWMLPLIFTWLAFGADYTSPEQADKKYTQNYYLKKAVKYSIFKWQKIYSIENIIPALLLSEQYNEVIKYYEQMEKANIETNIAKTLSTYAYIKTGKYDKALQLAKETNNLYQQARIYIDTKDLDKAKATVEKIFSTKKKVPNAYLYVAEIQLIEGHPKSALQSIDKLLAANPKHVEALEVKAKIYEKMGQKIKAEVHYLKAKQIKDERRQKGY